jgi:hypothetical protein
MDVLRVEELCQSLKREAGATLAMVVDPAGGVLAASGDTSEADGDALKLLASSNSDVANILSEKECVILQPRQSLIIRLLAGGQMVLVAFAAASSLEQVRELTRRAAELIEKATA